MVAALVGCCFCVEMAKITDKHSRTLTSSTLEWVDLESGQTPPSNALTITEDGPLWCRARHSANWISGAVKDGKCHIPFINQVFEKLEYEVLVSINDSARVVPKEWDRLRAIPLHGITTSTMLLAIAKSDEGDVSPGYVDSKKRRAYLLKDGKYQEQTSATILTEDEPKSYKVDHVVRDEEHSQTTTSEEVVSNTTLTNPGVEEQEISETLDYTAREIVYWGRVRGTITGLETTVMDPSGNVKEITWGIENELAHMVQQLVKFKLPPGAGINVDLIAVMHKYEAPYLAKLTAVYEDEVRRSRTITGLHIHTYLAELRANFSRPFYLSDNTEIEGEFLTSQILVHSTTTTTTTTTTPTTDGGSTLDDKKPQSDSLATTESENQLPTAQQVSASDTTTAALPGLVLLCCSLLLVFHLPARH
ncbi:uncharacterized protein LOC121862182 [Homarus americanus]|uniref:uncharacterized protein LOC121862182 n=1 Tax=Homarus americanus TaxID=6706 RepID=UPI001C45A197|nr:uncharacterized protein LOC121862182 [Homarus americanus]